jgi:hypothetical protein
MKKTLVVTLASALALGGSAYMANAEMETRSSTSTTEKTTTYSGTVSEVDPASSTIILKSESAPAPQRYTYTKETVFTDNAGHVVSYDAIKNSPVTVHYTRDGDRMIVTKVVQTKPAGATEMRKESTTTETHHEVH